MLFSFVDNILFIYLFIYYHLAFLIYLNQGCDNWLCFWNLPEKWRKLLRASIERILCSISLAEFNLFTNGFSRQTRAAPCIPVSGRMVSMYMSHVADIKHAERSSGILLFMPSAKASKSIPNSWLTRTDAIFLSQSSAALSSSCWFQVYNIIFKITEHQTNKQKS